MHVHFNQSNPNIQLDALYAAAKAEANREAARTRKKLSEFASKLAAALDGDEGVTVNLEPRDQSQEHAQNQNQQNRPIGNAEGSRDFKGATSRVSVGLTGAQSIGRPPLRFCLCSNPREFCQLGKACRATRQTLTHLCLVQFHKKQLTYFASADV